MKNSWNYRAFNKKVVTIEPIYKQNYFLKESQKKVIYTTPNISVSIGWTVKEWSS